MKIFLSRVELRVALVAAFMLLFAQAGALSHAYSHDSASASSQVRGSGHVACDDCLAYAPLLAPAGGSAALPFVEPPAHGPCVGAAARSLIALPPRLAFRSRAPPSSV